ncbi:MAG TPA: hypothetical protein VFX85_03590 [Solirubrobacterales bacterium]|nr:hypothetical protein [Solirubrobacterales bacterium]
MAIVMLAGLALLTVGCGSGEDGSERALEWSVDPPVDPNSNRVRLAATVEVCHVYVPLLEEPIVEYSGDRVYIELRQVPEELAEDTNGCVLGLLGAHKTIALERDLGELTLYDASTDPPKRRWPTG